MTTSQKSLVYVGLIIVFLVAIGGYLYPQTRMLAGAVSPSGVTNQTSLSPSITVAPLTTATTTWILNTGASDRFVTDVFSYCTGIGQSNAWNQAGTGGGLAAWTLQVSTSTAQTVGALANTNLVGNILISTSTAWNGVSSSTVNTAGFVSMNADWPVNTYLAFSFNATNTAACTVGVKAVAL